MAYFKQVIFPLDSPLRLLVNTKFLCYYVVVSFLTDFLNLLFRTELVIRNVLYCKKLSNKFYQNYMIKIVFLLPFT